MNTNKLLTLVFLALATLAGCTTLPPKLDIEPWTEAREREAMNWESPFYAEVKLPTPVGKLIEKLSDGHTGADRTPNITEAFNKAAGGEWELRPVTSDERELAPAQCRCACEYLVLTHASDLLNRWLVTLGTGRSCSAEPSIFPWRFMPQGFEKLVAERTYPVAVDRRYTVREQLTRGHFDRVQKGGVDLDAVSSTKDERYQVTMQLVEFSKKHDSTAAFTTDLAKSGLRPATLEEALAFAAQYTNTYSARTIVILGWTQEVLSQNWQGNEYTITYHASLSFREWRKLSFGEQAIQDKYVLMVRE